MLSTFLYNIILTLPGLQLLNRFCSFLSVYLLKYPPTQTHTLRPKPTHFRSRLLVESMILKKMQSVTSLLSHRMPQGMLLKTKGYCSSPESCCSCTKTTKHPNFQLMLEWPALCPGCQKRTTFFPTEICLTRSVKLLNPHSSPHKAFCLVHQLHSYYSRVNVIIFFVSFFLKC